MSSPLKVQHARQLAEAKQTKHGKGVGQEKEQLFWSVSCRDPKDQNVCLNMALRARQVQTFIHRLINCCSVTQCKLLVCRLPVITRT